MLKNIDFMAGRKIAAICSGIFLSVAIISLIFNQLDWGLDFTGGNLVEVSFEKTVSPERVRDVLNNDGFSGHVVQYFGSEKDILIRKLKTNLIYYLFKIFVSNIQKMHPVWVNSYEECWHLFKLNMNIYNLDFQLGLNFFGDYIIKENGYQAYNDYALLLKIITFDKENKKLVLKCPEHFLFTNHLKKIFPKSKFIWMHRDPGKTICSYSKMIYEVQKFYYGKKNIKKSEVANFVKNKFYKMLKTGLKIRDKNEDDFIDVNYINLINDTKHTLNYISSKCDFDIKNIDLLKMRNKKLNKLKNKTNYSLDEFNLNRTDINDLFKNYLKKFDIKIEY